MSVSRRYITLVPSLPPSHVFFPVDPSCYVVFLNHCLCFPQSQLPVPSDLHTDFKLYCCFFVFLFSPHSFFGQIHFLSPDSLIASDSDWLFCFFSSLYLVFAFSFDTLSSPLFLYVDSSLSSLTGDCLQLDFIFSFFSFSRIQFSSLKFSFFCNV